MSGLHWLEWFDDHVVKQSEIRRPYLKQSIFLLTARRIITSRISLSNSADEKGKLECLFESISRALEAADHYKLKTKRTDDLDRIFHQAVKTICSVLELDKAENFGVERMERKLTISNKTSPRSVFLMTFWPANISRQRMSHQLSYVVAKGLTLRDLLLSTYDKSLEEKSRIPSFSLNQNPGFFTLIPITVKDFHLLGRPASKCQLHLHLPTTICQLDLQQEISDPSQGLHLLLDRPIPESEVAGFPTERRTEIIQSYRNIWRLDEKEPYYCAREISGCLVLLDPRKLYTRGDVFSVQSFALETQGLTREIIVTVGAPPDQEPASHGPTEATPSPLDILKMQRSQPISNIATLTTGCSSFETFESLPLTPISAPSPSDEISCDTFKTAQEPPLELLSVLGLLEDPFPPNEPTTAATLPIDAPGNSRAEQPSYQQRAVSSAQAIAQLGPLSPQNNNSFISNAGNVNITDSHINLDFVTNFLRYEDNVQAGLHTLRIRSDPTAYHGSYERQVRVHRQMKVLRNLGSQLLITSSTTPREFRLSIPRINTHDLEEVVKDVFIWLYAASSPVSIMWVYDEGDDGNSRTSLLAEFLAKFLDGRRDLTASYFYTQQNIHSIIPTLALQIAHSIVEVEAPIARTAGNDPWIFVLSLEEQLQRLIVDPLQAASEICEGKLPRLFLIHALEDCEDDDFQELFLQAFGKALVSMQQSRIPQKLMLLGKHTPRLRECFSTVGLQEIVRLRPLPVSQDVAA